MLLLLSLACRSPQSGDSQPAVDSPAGDTQDSDRPGDTDTGPHDSGDPGFTCGVSQEPETPATIPARRLSSETTWTLSFDEEAEVAGLSDCSYHRSYTGVEILDQPYLCPDCEVITGGDATMTEGADCFAQISEGEGSRPEWWGLGADGQVWRVSRENLRMASPTGVVSTGDGSGASYSWEAEIALSAGGTVLLSATGSATVTQTDTLLPEPFPERQTPYAGGWPQADPGTLVGDWDLQVGDTFPNALEQDLCGERVYLHDFADRYLILDISQYNCGPCQTMAQEFPAFQSELAAQGIQVDMATFMGNGLSDPLVPPSQDIVDQWTERFGVHGPLFLDRGFAYNTLHDFLEEYSQEDIGFPAWVILGPDMELLYGNIGYGSYETAQEVIQTHAAQ